jgi:hypothetical protein
MFNAKTHDNFLNQDEVRFFLDTLVNTDKWEPSSIEFWNDRVINIRTAKTHFGQEFADKLTEISERTKEFIKSNYSLEKNIEPDIVTMCRWFPGMSQPPHADDMTNTKVKGLEHRIFGAIVYLNDDYEGGKTFYPDYDIEITPESGKLAVHPGDTNHMHGVTEITGNVRYTIASFWKYKDE